MLNNNIYDLFFYKFVSQLNKFEDISSNFNRKALQILFEIWINTSFAYTFSKCVLQTRTGFIYGSWRVDQIKPHWLDKTGQIKPHLPGGSQITKRAEGDETADGEETASGAKKRKKNHTNK